MLGTCIRPYGVDKFHVAIWSHLQTLESKYRLIIFVNSARVVWRSECLIYFALFPDCSLETTLQLGSSINNAPGYYYYY